MGIDIDKTISRTFIIGGLLGGAAGFLFGLNFSFAYNMGFAPGVKAFAAAVLGGIGNIRGAMLGGLLLGVVENLVLLIPGFDASWTDVVGVRRPGRRADVPPDRHSRRACGAGGMTDASCAHDAATSGADPRAFAPHRFW